MIDGNAALVLADKIRGERYYFSRSSAMTWWTIALMLLTQFARSPLFPKLLSCLVTNTSPTSIIHCMLGLTDGHAASNPMSEEELATVNIAKALAPHIKD